jgi:N-acetylglucosamine kinase-like BadF-type ATPase
MEPKPLTLTDSERISSIYKDSEIVITIVGDGSKTFLQVIDTKTLTALDIEYEGVATKTLVSGSANISNVGFPQAQANLDDLLRRVSMSKIGTNKRELKDLEPKGIISGIAGLVANADKKPSIMDLFARYGFDTSMVYLAGDVDLAKQLIGDEGAILISGTGSICFSKVAGEEKRVGGFGYIIGDQGSGFYIGKLALEAALESHFEKTDPFVLMGKLCEIFGIASINESIKLLYTDKTITPGDVAKAFPFVFDAAFNQNDARCKLIIEQAAAELAKQVTRAVKGSSKPDFPIYLIGDVFKTEQADLFIDMIRQRVNCSPGLSLINVAQENIAVRVMANEVKVTQARRLELV